MTSEYPHIHDATEYFWRLAKLYRLQVSLVLVRAPTANWNGQFELSNKLTSFLWPHGTVRLNVDLNIPRSREEVFHTVRHEIAHAICNFRHERNMGHGPEWIRVAKLLRVKTAPYEPGGRWWLEDRQQRRLLRDGHNSNECPPPAGCACCGAHKSAQL